MDNDLRKRWVGAYIGEVVYTKDPEELGRIQVRVPEVHGLKTKDNLDENLPWSFLSSSFGGFYDGGSHLPPPVGSSVLMVFEHGDSDRGWVLGGAPKRPLPKEWVYGEDGESMGKWVPGDAETDIPKEVRGDREQSKYVLFKTPKGVAIVIEERDEEEAVYLVDRAGQVIEFVSPVTSAANQANGAQRGTRSAQNGDQLPYAQMVGSEASVRLIDLAQQHIRLKALEGGESIEILNQKRGGGDQQKIILDNTLDAEEIRIIDKKGQRIVLRCGSGAKNILLQSGNARIRIDGDADEIHIDAGRVDINKPGPPGE